MLLRSIVPQLRRALDEFPVVALLGPRQVGKTTLVKNLLDVDAAGVEYLDLELPSHRNRLTDAELYLRSRNDRLMVLDEIQVLPDLFPVLRALVDVDRRPGRFLLLGSASPALLQSSSESLAGRITYIELGPLDLLELQGHGDWRSHWLRGGFPLSVLARDDGSSGRWLDAFLRSLIERDFSNLGMTAPPLVLRRFLTMLAHRHGQVWNSSPMAAGLELSNPTIARYRNFLEDAFLLRGLPAYHANVGKRLVKKPKVYLRDSGILHRLLGIGDRGVLHGHPILGASFEGYVVQQVAGRLAEGLELSFWRTSAGAEVDLVVHDGSRVHALVEIKYASAPKLTRGFYAAREDLGNPPAWIVSPVDEGYPIATDVRVVGVVEAMTLASQGFAST